MVTSTWMRLTTGLLAGVCLLSIGANVWQVASRGEAGVTTVPLMGSRPAKRSDSQGDRPRLPSADKKTPPEIANLDRATLEKRLAAAEARLDAALPLEEKFDVSPRSPENEARMRPAFDRVFQTKPGEQPLYSLECHGPVCRLETEVSMNEWQEPLIAEEDAIFSKMQVGQPISYMRLEESGRAAGIKYSMNLIMDFLDGPAGKECKERNPARGTVEFALHLDASSHKVLVTTSGALANEAVGVCLRRALEDLIDHRPTPPEMTAVIEESFQVNVP